MINKGFLNAGSKALFLSAAVAFFPNAFADHTDQAHGLVTASHLSDQIVWTPIETPPAGYGLQLTVHGPDDWYLRRQFDPGSPAIFCRSGDLESAAPNGSYTYELKLVVVDPLLMTTRFDHDEEPAQPPPAESYSGSFRLSGGALVADPDVPEGMTTRQTIAENLIVQANLCVGNDCTDEGFGNDIIRLKENSIRIHFDDTSTLPDFPANDWRLIANDSTTGGADKFSIEDSTAGKTPFTIEADAPNNAFYVQSDGDVGIGTSVPVFNLHVVDGNTPTLRLEQDASSTFTPQTWDIAGNESNFYVKDATAAGNLVFRIQAGAPENSMFIESTGDVGLGTNSPSAALHIRRTSVERDMLLIQPAGAGDPLFRIKGSGDASLLKVLSEGSDRNKKKNIDPVDTAEVLDRVVGLPVATWTYKTDDDSIRHMGPMAQDFHANFGLGTDNKHIAPMDGVGVALAAIQDLYKQIRRQGDEIKVLQDENRRLQERVKF